MSCKLFLSWVDVDSYCDNIHTQLANVNIDKIIAVGRGGYVPGVILSNRMNCRNVTSMITKSYTDSNEQTSLHITQEPVLGECKHILVVDDIVDSGVTFKYIHKYLSEKCAANMPKITFAALVYKPNKEFNIDVFGAMADNTDWIVFPWECRSLHG